MPSLTFFAAEGQGWFREQQNLSVEDSEHQGKVYWTTSGTSPEDSSFYHDCQQLQLSLTLLVSHHVQRRNFPWSPRHFFLKCWWQHSHPCPSPARNADSNEYGLPMSLERFHHNPNTPDSFSLDQPLQHNHQPSKPCKLWMWWGDSKQHQWCASPSCGSSPFQPRSTSQTQLFRTSPQDRGLSCGESRHADDESFCAYVQLEHGLFPCSCCLFSSCSISASTSWADPQTSTGDSPLLNVTKLLIPTSIPMADNFGNGGSRSSRSTVRTMCHWSTYRTTEAFLMMPSMSRVLTNFMLPIFGNLILSPSSSRKLLPWGYVNDRNRCSFLNLGKPTRRFALSPSKNLWKAVSRRRSVA